MSRMYVAMTRAPGLLLALVLALFATTAVANVYMSAFARLRLDVKAERLHTEAAEREIHGAAPPRPARRA